MNARQIKKRLKKQIDKLERDNDLMRRIIADSPTMQEIYDLFNKPLNIRHTTMEFKEYRSKRYLPPDRPDDYGLIALFKKYMAEELCSDIKENISYEIDREWGAPTITASIYIGRK